MKQIIDFSTPKREFILHNAGPEKVELMYGGETKYLPPCTEVVANPGNVFGVFESGKDADGDPIPGSLAFRDLYEKDPVTGNSYMVWDSWEAAKHCLGIDPKTGETTSQYAGRGISLIPAASSKEEIAEIKAAGRMRYEDFKIGEARQIIAAQDEDNSRRRRQGHVELPGDARYEQALLVLAAAHERQKAKVAQMFGAIVPKQTVAPDTGAAAKLPEVEDAVVEEMLEDRLKEAAKEFASEMEEKSVMEWTDLVNKLKADPKFMKAMKSQFQMKKWSEVERATSKVV